MDFVKAEYVAPAGGPGRPAEPNPFTDIINEIALKLDETTQKPVAVAFQFEHDDRDKEDGDYNRKISGFKRQLSEAGAKNDPPVTVVSVARPVTNPVNHKESATKTNFTFWTVKRQTRKRSVTGTTSNEQSLAVTTP